MGVMVLLIVDGGGDGGTARTVVASSDGGTTRTIVAGGDGGTARAIVASAAEHCFLQ